MGLGRRLCVKGLTAQASQVRTPHGNLTQGVCNPSGLAELGGGDGKTLLQSVQLRNKRGISSLNQEGLKDGHPRWSPDSQLYIHQGTKPSQTTCHTYTYICKVLFKGDGGTHL